VARWVTIFGRADHLGAEPGTQAYSAEPARARGLAVFAECLAGGWSAEISADLREAVAH